MKPIEIVVVKYNLPKLEKDCIYSVIENTEYPYHLRVFDNYPQKLNLGSLWNTLMHQSPSDYICLLNSDTRVSKRWLSRLAEVFERESNVGAVGPSTNSSKNQQSKDWKKVDINRGYRIVDFTSSYPGWTLSGFCLLLNREKVLQSGGCPNDFGFYGQEVAMLDRLSRHGFRQIWRKDVFVWHKGSASAKAAQARGEMDEEKERELGRINYQKLRNAN